MVYQRRNIFVWCCPTSNNQTVEQIESVQSTTVEDSHAEEVWRLLRCGIF